MNSTDIEGSIALIHNHSYSTDSCFLCGRIFNSSDVKKTEEHIFPKWLQEEFNLWNKNIKLPNKTVIKYKDARIPCCSDCNNRLLSQLEIIIKKAFFEGYTDVIKMDRIDLYRWMCKMFVANLYKDAFLALEMYDSKIGTIVDKKHLSAYQLLHIWILFLNRGLQNPDKLDSMLILKSQLPKSKVERFYCTCEYIYGVIALRLNDCFILVNFNDNGLLLDKFSNYYNRLRDISLHPFQCLEVVSMFSYHAKLVDNNINVTFENNDGLIKPIVNIIDSDKNNSLPDQIDTSSFALIFSQYSNLSFEDLYLSDKKFKSFLFDDNDKIISWEVEKAFPIKQREELKTNTSIEQKAAVYKDAIKQPFGSTKADELQNISNGFTSKAIEHERIAVNNPHLIEHFKIAGDYFLKAINATESILKHMDKHNYKMRMPVSITIEYYKYYYNKEYFYFEQAKGDYDKALLFAEKSLQFINKAIKLLERNINAFDDITKLIFLEDKPEYLYNQLKIKYYCNNLKRFKLLDEYDFESAAKYSEILLDIQEDILASTSKLNKLDIDQNVEELLYCTNKCCYSFCKVIHFLMNNDGGKYNREITLMIKDTLKYNYKYDKIKGKNKKVMKKTLDDLILGYIYSDITTIILHNITKGISTKIIKFVNKILKKQNSWVIDIL